MNDPLLVALPWLHGPLPDAVGPLWSQALRLWPGLPGVPATGWFCPSEYPFTPQEAAACAEDIRRMGNDALSGLPLVISTVDTKTDIRIAAETALLAALDASGGDTGAARAAEAVHRELLARQQAQKILLWVWQQEEYMLELSRLAARFASTADSLTTSLGAESDGEGFGTDVLTEDFVRLSTPITMDTGLAPSWRTVVSNALFFLSPNIAIAMEGPLCENTFERLGFTLEPRWLSALAETDGICTLEAYAPGWKVLGHTRPTGQPALDTERLWLAWRRTA